MELPEKEPEKAEEQQDLTPLMRLIAGKFGEMSKQIEEIGKEVTAHFEKSWMQIHQDMVKINDNMCQVLRRMDR